MLQEIIGFHRQYHYVNSHEHMIINSKSNHVVFHRDVSPSACLDRIAFRRWKEHCAIRLPNAAVVYIRPKDDDRALQSKKAPMANSLKSPTKLPPLDHQVDAQLQNDLVRYHSLSCWSIVPNSWPLCLCHVSLFSSVHIEHTRTVL